ncbi:hypothetical protein HHI36_003957 [Cryptolaemus montrouzieri]|uniref:Uncharacterized protein n=1 Tax=Cryptolaemus montrouzieri TaxID=559131 RepID=A0ABD2NQS8_9CUCU
MITVCVCVFSQRLYFIRMHSCIAWWECSLEKRSQFKLFKLQRTACMMITGASRSTSTAAIEIILGLAPLHLVIRGATRMATYIFHHLSRNETSMFRFVSGALQSEIEDSQMLSMKSDIAIPKPTWCCHSRSSFLANRNAPAPRTVYLRVEPVYMVKVLPRNSRSVLEGL